MIADISILINKDLSTCYVTDKLEVFEKTFCGRVWAFFHPDSLNSNKVATAIDKLMTRQGVLTGVSQTDRGKLAENLQNLATRFAHIKDTHRANSSSYSVMNSYRRLFDRVQASSNPLQTQAHQRTRAGSLSDLYPATGEVPVKPQPKDSATPPKGPVAPPAQPLAAELPKGVSQADADRQPARALNGYGSQLVTEVTRGEVRVRPKVDPLLVPDFLPPVDTVAWRVVQTTDLGANLNAQRDKMGLPPVVE